jgi:hypothetical protein
MRDYHKKSRNTKEDSFQTAPRRGLATSRFRVCYLRNCCPPSLVLVDRLCEKKNRYAIRNVRRFSSFCSSMVPIRDLLVSYVRLARKPGKTRYQRTYLRLHTRPAGEVPCGPGFVLLDQQRLIQFDRGRKWRSDGITVIQCRTDCNSLLMKFSYFSCAAFRPRFARARDKPAPCHVVPPCPACRRSVLREGVGRRAPGLAWASRL